MEDETNQPAALQLLAAFLRRILVDRKSSYEAIYTAVGGTPENLDRFFKALLADGYIVIGRGGIYLLTTRGKRIVKKSGGAA